MSARAVAWAWSAPAVGASTDRLLLLHLADRADETGHGRTSWSGMADAVAPRGRLVDGYLERLTRRGFVTVHEADGDVFDFELALVEP